MYLFIRQRPVRRTDVNNTEGDYYSTRVNVLIKIIRAKPRDVWHDADHVVRSYLLSPELTQSYLYYYCLKVASSIPILKLWRIDWLLNTRICITCLDLRHQKGVVYIWKVNLKHTRNTLILETNQWYNVHEFKLVFLLLLLYLLCSTFYYLYYYYYSELHRLLTCAEKLTDKSETIRSFTKTFMVAGL